MANLSTKKKILQSYEVNFPQRRQRDDIGKVFYWNGRIFRAIFLGKEKIVESFFESGLLPELVERGMVPNTIFSDVALEGHELTLEHERIWPVIYPQEWTFSMLRDAAILVGEMSNIVIKYGFNMKDCHGLNVLFNGTTPVFIDIGSIIPNTTVGWQPYEEYLRFYYYPLKIWKYCSYLGKLSIFSGNLTAHNDYINYLHPIFRNNIYNLREKMYDYYIQPNIVEQVSKISSIPNNTISKRNKIKLIIKRSIPKIIPVIDFSKESIFMEIRNIKQVKPNTTWGQYHGVIKEKSKRYPRIAEIVNKLIGKKMSAIDLGGNQGLFSKFILNNCNFSNVLCVDSDEIAVDSGYELNRITQIGKLSFAHFDFMGPTVKLRFDLPQERFKADVAFALALTHHLILSQGYEINNIFKNINDYAPEYVFIEFMPKGLWIPNQIVSVPDWYNIHWFRTHFVQYFDLILEEELRENNILLVGRVRATDN